MRQLKLRQPEIEIGLGGGRHQGGGLAKGGGGIVPMPGLHRLGSLMKRFLKFGGLAEDGQ